MYNFSKRSKNNLMTCEEDLQKIANLAIKRVDFSVIQGIRTLSQQKQNVAKGVSWTLKSKHLYNPSRAFDFIPYPFKGWDDREGFAKIGKILLECANELGIKARWGGDWNRNGSYQDEIKRGSFDAGHFELL